MLAIEINNNICLEILSKDNNINDFVVAFQNVIFPYDKQRNVLEDASFFVKRGEHVLLIGKSTLVRLLCGQKMPDCGDIWIDGKKICSETVCGTKQKIIFIP